MVLVRPACGPAGSATACPSRTPRRPAVSPLSPAGADGRPRASSPPRPPPRGCRGPSWACCPSCPRRCRRRDGHQDTVTEALVIDRPTHCCPARNAHAVRAATTSRTTLGRAGAETNSQMVLSHLCADGDAQSLPPDAIRATPNRVPPTRPAIGQAAFSPPVPVVRGGDQFCGRFLLQSGEMQSLRNGLGGAHGHHRAAAAARAQQGPRRPSRPGGLQDAAC
jgi:hypothetical protein